MSDLTEKSAGMAQLMSKLMLDTTDPDPKKQATGYALLEIILMINEKMGSYTNQIDALGTQYDDLNTVRTDLSNVITDVQNIQNWQATNSDPNENCLDVNGNPIPVNPPTNPPTYYKVVDHPDFDARFLKLVNTYVNDFLKLNSDNTTILNKKNPDGSPMYPPGSDMANALGEITSAITNFCSIGSPTNGGNKYDPSNYPNPDVYGEMVSMWQQYNGAGGGDGRYLAYDLYMDSKASSGSGSTETGVFGQFMNGGPGGMGYQQVSTDLTTTGQTWNTTLTSDGTYMNQIVQSSQNFVSTMTGEMSYMVQKQIAS